MRTLFRYIIRPIAEILLYVSLSTLFVVFCIIWLGDLYGILAVFGSVFLWAIFASIIERATIKWFFDVDAARSKLHKAYEKLR